MGRDRPLTPKQQRREEKKRQQREAKRARQEERRRKREALERAYTAQDSTGNSTQTVDSSTLPCKKAKAGVEVTVASEGGRAVNAAKVTFSATGSSIEKTTKRDRKAFLPLKFGTDVTFKGVVTDPPAAGFEEAELEDTVRAREGELTTGTLTFTARPSKLRVKVVKTGTTDAVPGARAKLGGEEKAAGANGALFEQLFEDEYDVEAIVDLADWLKPDGIEGRVVDPTNDDDVETIEVDPRPWIKVKLHDTKANAVMAKVTVKLTEPDDKPAEKTTNDQGIAEHKMDEQADDATCKIRELVTELEESGEPQVVYEFVAIEES